MYIIKGIFETFLFRRNVMSERSTMIALSLLFLPSLSLVAIRISISPFSEALANEPSTELIVHISALLIGLFLLWRYNSRHDHEVLRSKAISRLSKTYKQEDKGYNDPFTEMVEMKRQYENEQHEKAMKAQIKKENLDEELRRKGLI